MGGRARSTAVQALKGHDTRTDFDLLSAGFPGELIEGQLVKEPAPTQGHNRICARIRARLVALRGPDQVADSLSHVAIDDHNVFRPDVVVLAARLVNPATRTIEVRTEAGRRFARGGHRATSEAAPTFELVPAELLSPPRSR